MAPPTGPRGARSARPGPRLTRGGGIGKRHTAPRTDQDGDVSMGSASRSAGPPTRSARGARGSRGGRATRASGRLAQNLRNYVSDSDGTGRTSKAQFNKTTLKIRGLKDSKAANNPDGGLRSLLDFLERKASRERPITLGKGVMQGDYVLVKVSKDDASHILRLNGYTYAGAPLTIEESSEPVPGPDRTSVKDPATVDARQKLLGILASRYNAEQKLLDLSALGADPILVTMGSFASKNLAGKSFKALLHLTSSQYDNSDAKEEAIQAVSLANNAILDVSEVFTLAHALPRLRRLDLSGNLLEDPSKISKWRHEFRRLEELHLVGNPIVSQPNSLPQIVDWFPSLQILNGERVRTPQEAADSLKAWYPTPLPRLPSNLRDGENNVASTFLHLFFRLYDHDRADLAAQFYDADSCFSVDESAVPKGTPATQSYTKYTRNILELGVRNSSTQQRLFTGRPLISELWAALPATRHASLELTELWKIDCHTFANLADPSGQNSAMGLLINVISRFEEVDVSQQLAGIREFSRAFILGPSMPGARHPYRVVSDKLTLRTWTPQTPGVVAAPVPAALNPVAPVAPVVVAAPPALDPATRLAMVQELAKQTGMTAEYAELCLSGPANWDFGLALASFHEKRAQLPPEAFVTPV